MEQPSPKVPSLLMGRNSQRPLPLDCEGERALRRITRLDRKLLLVQLGVDGIVGFVFGNHLFHFFHNFHIIIGIGQSDQFVDILQDIVVVILPYIGNSDFLVETRFGILFCGEQFLVEFLTRPQTCVFDLNVLQSAQWHAG